MAVGELRQLDENGPAHVIDGGHAHLRAVDADVEAVDGVADEVDARLESGGGGGAGHVDEEDDIRLAFAP